VLNNKKRSGILPLLFFDKTALKLISHISRRPYELPLALAGGSD
jgi:hypothetical protein